MVKRWSGIFLDHIKEEEQKNINFSSHQIGRGRVVFGIYFYNYYYLLESFFRFLLREIPLLSGKPHTSWIRHITPRLRLPIHLPVSVSPSTIPTPSFTVGPSTFLETWSWAITSQDRFVLVERSHFPRVSPWSRPSPIPCNVTGVSRGRIPITVHSTGLHGCHPSVSNRNICGLVVLIRFLTR